MGIYNAVINDIGTSFKAGLEGLIEQIKQDQPMVDILGELRSQLSKNGDEIQVPQGKLTLTMNDILDEAEAVFDYEGNSGGYNSPEIKKTAQVLKKIGYTAKVDEEDKKKCCFSNGSYEINVEPQRVRIKVKGKPLYEANRKGTIRFQNYIQDCKIIFNELLGKKTEEQQPENNQPPEETTVRNDTDNNTLPLSDEDNSPMSVNHPYSSPDEFYAALGKNITPAWFKEGETLTIAYDGIEIKLNATQNGNPTVQAHISFEQERDVTDYKKNHGDTVFNTLGKLGATYTSKVEPDPTNLRTIVEATIESYDALMRNTKIITQPTSPAK